MKDWEAVVVGAAVGVGVGLLGAAAVSAFVPPARAPYSAVAAHADWRFYRGLVRVSQDPTEAWHVRAAARVGARLFKANWLDAGKAGCATPAGFRVRVYGNWCGSGYGSGPCINSVDCLCRDHDIERTAAFA